MRIYFSNTCRFSESGNDEYAPAQDWLATKFEPRKSRNILPERGYLSRLEMAQCGTAIARLLLLHSRCGESRLH
jgi:hypothetical protein